MNIRKPAPASWYDANGYRQWHHPLDEVPDESTDESWEAPRHRAGGWLPLILLLSLTILTVVAIWAWVGGAFDNPSPLVTPAPYGYPCEVRTAG